MHEFISFRSGATRVIETASRVIRETEKNTMMPQAERKAIIAEMQRQINNAKEILNSPQQGFITCEKSEVGNMRILENPVRNNN